MLDNGAFTIWQRVRTGKPVPPRLVAAAAGEWSDYYAWVEPWLDYRTTWAVIPDVIDGDEDSNDALLTEWPHGDRGAPVWHMHESTDRLLGLARSWPRVCIGSSGSYAEVGSPAWHRRMHHAMDCLCGDGPAPTWLHMLRGLKLAGSRYPFASADSAAIARNHAGNLTRATPAREPRAMADEFDARQCAARWRVGEPQLELAAQIEVPCPSR